LLNSDIELIQTVVCFFHGWNFFSLNPFDDLKKDEGYRGVIENREKEMASPHTMKRFFKSFSFVLIWHFTLWNSLASKKSFYSRG